MINFKNSTSNSRSWDILTLTILHIHTEFRKTGFSYAAQKLSKKPTCDLLELLSYFDVLNLPEEEQSQCLADKTRVQVLNKLCSCSSNWGEFNQVKIYRTYSKHQ